jgi:adenylyltransferase/sulfurtransferase
VKRELSHQQAIKFARQIMLPNFDMDKQIILQQSKALMVGAGGLGCAVAQYLLSSGLGQLTIIDDDKVERHNLPRQILYTEQDIGQFKASTAARFLNAKHSESKVSSICERLNDSDLAAQIAAHNIVIDSSDNLHTRKTLNKLCYANKIPLVSGAAIRMEGQVFNVLPLEQSACYECFSQFYQEQELSCHQAGVMSPVVGIIGNLQALETIKILTHFGSPLCNTLLVFDGMQSEWIKLNVNKSPTCRVCNA